MYPNQNDDDMLFALVMLILNWITNPHTFIAVKVWRVYHICVYVAQKVQIDFVDRQNIIIGHPILSSQSIQWVTHL